MQMHFEIRSIRKLVILDLEHKVSNRTTILIGRIQKMNLRVLNFYYFTLNLSQSATSACLKDAKCLDFILVFQMPPKIISSKRPPLGTRKVGKKLLVWMHARNDGAELLVCGILKFEKREKLLQIFIWKTAISEHSIPIPTLYLAFPMLDLAFPMLDLAFPILDLAS